MAETYFGKNDALTRKIWAAKLFKEAMQDIFLTKFMGKSEDNIIQVKTDLTKEKGDKITIGLRMRLTGSGQSSQTGITLEGNEESLVFYDFGVELSEYGHAVRARSKLDLQRPAFDLRTEMKDALKEWLSEKMEKLTVTALAGSPTTNRYLDKSSTTLTCALIRQIKRQASMASPKIRPIKINGGKHYVLLAHTYAVKELKEETEWKNNQLYANIRGSKNPIFSGALGVLDGVVIHEYDRSELLQSGNVGRCLLLGAQAGVVAWGQYPSWYEKLFDYERIPGVAVDMILGVGKSVFNSEDFGVYTVDVGYTPDS